LVLDASVISDVDLTAAETLIELHDELDERGVELVLVDLLADVQDLLSRAGLLDRLGRGLVFDTAEDAINAFRARSGS
jgi:sulfate permease, SulP family